MRATLPFLLLFPLLASGQTVTFQQDGKATIACTCVVQSATCQGIGVDQTGATVHNWLYDVHTKAGVTADLGEVCWRKRNVEKLGDGLCCDPAATNNFEEERATYRGTLQK